MSFNLLIFPITSFFLSPVGYLFPITPSLFLFTFFVFSCFLPKTTFFSIFALFIHYFHLYQIIILLPLFVLFPFPFCWYFPSRQIHWCLSSTFHSSSTLAKCTVELEDQHLAITPTRTLPLGLTLWMIPTFSPSPNISVPFGSLSTRLLFLLLA